MSSLAIGQTLTRSGLDRPSAFYPEAPPSNEPDDRVTHDDGATFNARWDRDLKAKLAAVHADEILAALRRLERDWRAYQRRFPPAPTGQLDLFTDAR